MFSPHTVTLYIVTENDDYTTNIDTTILKGVFLDATNGKMVSTPGTNNADMATLFVPFSVEAHGLNGEVKEYIDIKRYRDLEDPSRYWTFDPSGESSAADCFFVKGEVHNTLEYSEAKRLYPDVYKVSRVATRDFGSKDMWHWQVSCV